MNRTAQIHRETRETRIALTLTLDGVGRSKIDTGIGFFNHMLETLARHGGLDLEVEARSDLDVDEHHTAEDTGICFGEALAHALGDKKGITRFGWALCPMDDALARAGIDLSGRGFCAVEAPVRSLRLGGMAGDALMEFFQGVARGAALTLHLDVLRGENGHHMAEAAFKAFAKALQQAAALSGRATDVPSTKGTL
jgi:imidazoleglycerol-phosphate dehydratase